MPYSILATSKTPALVIYLIDVSGSMGDVLDGARKIDHVNNAIESVLIRMIQRSTKGEVISPRYRLSLVLYSDEPMDVFGGIETITEVARRGRPRLSVTNSTETAQAFSYARDLLKLELPKLAGHPAPMVCHLTDGKFTGRDPEQIAQEIMGMRNDDGPVLVENIYVGPGLTRLPISSADQWRGIESPDDLLDPYAAKLYRMSSPMPATYAEVIAEEGYSLASGVPMLIPGTSKDLIELAFAMSGATPTA